MISIRTPIWKTKSVGIDEKKITKGVNQLEVLYKDMFGKKLYPHIYKMDGSKMLSYPTQYVKGHNLKIIPIADFDYEGKELLCCSNQNTPILKRQNVKQETPSLF